VCPDGLVYNLEVETTHTYLVDGLVVHNCHAAAGIARTFFGNRFSKGSALSVGRHLPPAARILYEERLQGYLDYCVEHKGQRITAAITDPRVTTMIGAIDEAARAYREAGRQYMASADEEAHRKGRRFLAYGERAARASVRLDSLVEAASPSSVYYVDAEHPALVSSLVDVGPELSGKLWTSGKAAILTSATLSIAGRMTYLRQELGLPPETTETVLPSPFDYATHCRLIVPDLPLPTERDWEEAALEAMAEAIEYARGRTLVLCTTHRMLNKAYEYLVSRVPYTVYRQRHAAERTATTAKFKADVSSVLIGTESYWAGVDVPGESLSCVVIDKLPFPSPEDHVIAALTARYPESYEAFLRVSIPRAAIQFKQGFGRLIRSVTDRGAVVCLDRRLTTKGYGRQFLRSIPTVPVSNRLEDIREIVP
jgi:ATP-dependent DNA helicase DinG